jgi:TonB family protein
VRPLEASAPSRAIHPAAIPRRHDVDLDDRSAAAPGDKARQAFAFSLSLVLHLTLAIALVLLTTREVGMAPLEISIFEGPIGPASPPPGDESAAPGRVAPAPDQVEPVEARHATKAVRPPRPRTVAKPAPVERAAQNPGPLAARRQDGSAQTAEALQAAESSIRLRQAPQIESTHTTDTTLGPARPPSDDLADARVETSEPARTGSVAPDVAKAVVPGPGGGGSGWNAGAGGSGSGGGGNGRGGFSVTGAGAGGAGRSYASIWEWTRSYLPGLRAAYDNQLRNNAALQGVILVRYEILASGAVGDVTMVSSQMRDPHLEQEVLRQIRGWHYPPEPSGTVVVTWPFAFVPPK